MLELCRREGVSQERIDRALGWTPRASKAANARRLALLEADAAAAAEAAKAAPADAVPMSKGKKPRAGGKLRPFGLR